MKIKTLLFLSFLLGFITVQLPAQISDSNGGILVFDTYMVTLRPDVTMDQYLGFLKTKYVSEYDKNFPGSRLTIVSPDLWIKKNQYSFFFSFETMKDWYKYYPNGKEMSVEAKAAWEKMKTVKQEESKYISDSKRVDTEWERWFDEVIVK
jgi:hypothetical protein